MDNTDKRKKPNRFHEIHLELEGDYENPEIMKSLTQYGKVKKSISRDIAVPEDISLHALHFAIQRAFGWQNSHLHHFVIDDDYSRTELNALTDHSFGNYLRLCGVLFRFPYENGNEEDMKQIYYDDDYDGYESPKTWLRRKYTGPYHYEADFEHYLDSQAQAVLLRAEHEEVALRPSFKEYMEAKENHTRAEVHQIRLDGMSVDQAAILFDSGVGEILERLRLDQVLGKEHLCSKENLMNICAEAEKDIDAKINRALEIDDQLKQIMPVVHKMNDIINKRSSTKKDWEYLMKNRHYRDEGIDLIMEKAELVESADPGLSPILDKLYYFYDYGDGWMVTVTMKQTYTAHETESGSYCFTDEKGNAPDSDTVISLDKACKSYCAKCIRYDGLPLMDDVGGVYGYARFLETIHSDDIEERNEMKEWAAMQGWNGRSVKPENLL